MQIAKLYLHYFFLHHTCSYSRATVISSATWQH